MLIETMLRGQTAQSCGFETMYRICSKHWLCHMLDSWPGWQCV